MTIRRLTPEETRAIFAQGLIIFNPPSQAFLQKYKHRCRLEGQSQPIDRDTGSPQSEEPKAQGGDHD
jgi:hypothetical protein